jgi:hypothetical protein
MQKIVPVPNTIKSLFPLARRFGAFGFPAFGPASSPWGFHFIGSFAESQAWGFAQACNRHHSIIHSRFGVVVLVMA